MYDVVNTAVSHLQHQLYMYIYAHIIEVGGGVKSKVLLIAAISAFLCLHSNAIILKQATTCKENISDFMSRWMPLLINLVHSEEGSFEPNDLLSSVGICLIS